MSVVAFATKTTGNYSFNVNLACYKEVPPMPELTSLTLINTEVEKLPVMNKLKFLSLDGCFIKDLPTGLTSLTSLSLLGCDEIEELPQDLFSLTVICHSL